MRIKRIYHPYEKWEDYINGMWRKVTPEEEKEFLQKAIEFTGDHKLYGSWMQKVIKAWPVACEHNLTDTGMNRRAWVGHAAVSLAINCPEYITRMAWWNLSKEQQDLANDQADRAIEKWERDYVLNRNNYKQNSLFVNLN
jgi:hypothetical protein